MLPPFAQTVTEVAHHLETNLPQGFRQKKLSGDLPRTALTRWKRRQANRFGNGCSDSLRVW